ncbi:putative DNA-binding transcriptional regulator YafY [Paenibacillus sp. LBL]|uniref:helix-turn-helix transcriptional regulator n=1 Tax=Paenibacillus sp. LBL TaxID=2940563 RepID=UPI0024738221|nr:HTH domain-containing protein [Paenibacillus sp. LBL]MDH6670081.1 putative DNA-binding transcriptional regulator YafY [Paenibacillus sp. LBL]
MSKADNMLAILWLLKARRRMTAKQLAEELDVHIRTIYRNIDALCISGVPIVSEIGRGGGYFIPDPIKLAPLFFDADEQKALLHAAAFAREAGYPSKAPLSRALSKIKRHTNPEQLERLTRRENSIEVIQPPTAPVLMSMLAAIEAGISTINAVSRSTIRQGMMVPYIHVSWIHMGLSIGRANGIRWVIATCGVKYAAFASIV